jgi:chromosome segregation ATPase
MPASDPGRRRAPHRLLAALAALLLLVPAAAAQQAELETRLRDALRQATARIRSLEDDNARLTARQAELEAEIGRLKQGGAGDATAAGPSQAALQKRVAELEKLFGEREKAFQGAVDEFNQRLQQERDQALQIQEQGQRWKSAYDEAVRVARAREAERQALARQLEQAATGVGQLEDRNRQLFAVGNEILDRYAGISVGDVLARREPFTGLKRVETENRIQDYRDRLLDNHVDTAPPPPPAPAAPPSDLPPPDTAPR